MATTKSKIVSQKIISDCLFTSALTALFLATRKHTLNKAYIVHKLSSFARSLLCYEKYKLINSQMDYIRRASIYILSAAVFDYLYFEVDNHFLDFGKGLSAGICFANVGVGIVMGLANLGGSSIIRDQLSEFV